MRFRKKIKNNGTNPVIHFLRSKICCCISFCRYEKEDYNYFKSRHRLASELDIKRILLTLRYLRSAVKFLTSAPERKWLRMQAEYVVVDESHNHRSDLMTDPQKKTLSELREMDENSSAFETDD